ncbi:ABC transporter ATP-binding protein [Achromobacter sp. CF-sbj1-Ac2-l]|uniref:Petrobactin import ATP-binding protein FpuD n=1 Tax=Achromobacter dolens TaxID=1287738 RepID=A0A6S7EA59_9BURK|nr:ABC transporter ATP-binding protein [Achromobacter dolens]CAB3899561.1 Petrobactin import ATP-binding protein FpuD [Achromobacter dolens]
MAQDLHVTPPSPGASALQLRQVHLSYGDRPVLRDLSLTVAPGAFTAVVGPNGCGKSTLLRVLGGALAPSQGQALLDGADLASLRRKAVARRLAYLPQNPVAPEMITVRDLVARGRYPHQTLLRQWSPADARAVDAALADTDLADLADHPVHTLSGGQRQRAWLALVLAQDAGIMLLDEPTTFLDIRHQIDLLELCARLHRAGRTLVVVLHDLNLAFRYADRVVMMRSGRIAAQGEVRQVVTEDAMRQVFDLECRVLPDPETGSPMVVPRRGGQG